ncbi:hypothetical protein [Nocardia blacklockiae]|uniref:hypothetical protein n=1 Tax=Nocardia blacklockiae TaxID=480036 RepID=UPI001894DB40|nr:hypothetical protein [Nocardia blacklockiae]MBF6176128.1 hypothetical protein [Nocardia blacklockiae]
MASDLATSRELRDDLQAITERAAALVGADHPAVAKLLQAADELARAALADRPRTYGELPDD